MAFAEMTKQINSCSFPAESALTFGVFFISPLFLALFSLFLSLPLFLPEISLVLARSIGHC